MMTTSLSVSGGQSGGAGASHSEGLWLSPFNSFMTSTLSCPKLTCPCPPTQDLREECLKLRTRVFDLEQQNRVLSVLFQQRIKPASDLLLQVGLTLLGSGGWSLIQSKMCGPESVSVLPRQPCHLNGTCRQN